MPEATPKNNAITSPGQHADPYLTQAEEAAKRSQQPDHPPTRPACNVSPAGLRLVTAIDVPIGTRIENLFARPVTLIGASDRDAIVRYDDGRIKVVPIGDLASAFTHKDKAFNDRVPAGASDKLNNMASLLGELLLIDTEDGVDERTVAEARGMARRIGQQIEAICREAFATSSTKSR